MLKWDGKMDFCLSEQWVLHLWAWWVFEKPLLCPWHLCVVQDSHFLCFPWACSIDIHTMAWPRSNLLQRDMHFLSPPGKFVLHKEDQNSEWHSPRPQPVQFSRSTKKGKEWCEVHMTLCILEIETWKLASKRKNNVANACYTNFKQFLVQFLVRAPSWHFRVKIQNAL